MSNHYWRVIIFNLYTNLKTGSEFDEYALTFNKIIGLTIYSSGGQHILADPRYLLSVKLYAFVRDINSKINKYII